MNAKKSISTKEEGSAKRWPQLMKKILYFCLSLLLLCALPHQAQATVQTAQPGEGATGIYVAGAPDSYPLEYYDKESGTYKGLMPKVLEQISKDTDLDFTYTHAGTEDRRQSLYQNKQVEMVSGLTGSEKDYKNLTKPLVSYKKGEDTISAAFAFSSVCDANTKATIEKALAGISGAELAAMSLEVALDAPEDGHKKRITALLIVLLFLALVLATIFFRYNRRLKKERASSDRTDPTTGIGNMNYLTYYFDKMVTDTVRPLCYAYYIGFDYQYIKETSGEDEAVNVMRYAANTLTDLARESDLVAALQNGAIVVIHQAVGQDDALVWGRDVAQRLANFVPKVHSDIKVRFWMGLYKLEMDDRALETILFNAQQGYRTAKAQGQDLVVADRALLMSARSRESYKLDIANGMDNDEFKVYVQFIMDSQSGAIAGGEVLSRWQHPKNGLLYVDDYLELIYQIGLGEAFDLYMLKKTCIFLDNLHKKGVEDFQLSCNISGLSLSSEGFAQRVDEVTRPYQFKHAMLIVEITEDALVQSAHTAQDNARRLKEAGYTIAVDDFGTGYSSFASLCACPVDIVKLDRGLLWSGETPKGEKMFRGVVELCHNMGFRVVAEGVETENQRAFVASSGADCIQGYFYYKPLPASEAYKVLDKTRKG